MMLLSSLSWLLVISCCTEVVLAASFSTTETPCRARAWVRAPDLEPGTIIQGDVRVKLSGSCAPISSCSLWLRFKERSWVKTLRAGIKLPEPPSRQSLPAVLSSLSGNNSVYETHGFSWMHLSLPGVNHSAWDQYEDYLKDPKLWLVREEERVGFEAKHDLHYDINFTREIIESFAIMIPLTDYPPAYDIPFLYPFGAARDAADTEHIYEYFVDLTFANGTSIQIPAGHTSFNAATPSKPLSTSETVTVAATPVDELVSEFIRFDDATPRDEFTLEVIFPHGRHIEQGSSANITVISHRHGPGLQLPLGLPFVTVGATQKRFWAAKYAGDDVAMEKLLNADIPSLFQLQPSHDDVSMKQRLSIPDNSYVGFSRKAEFKNDSHFTTEAVEMHLQIPQTTYPAFETYYQTTGVQVLINLHVGNISSALASSLTEIDDEDYNWIPERHGTLRHPAPETLTAKVPIVVYRRAEESPSTTLQDTVHYLSPMARSPTFINLSLVPELLEKTAKEREELVPMAKARFHTAENGDVAKYRYYEKGHGLGTLAPSGHYVGNTWVRKVVGKGDRYGHRGQ